MYNLLRPGGLLLLSTTHYPGIRGAGARYEVNYQLPGSSAHRTETISEWEFNEFASTSHGAGMLPVHVWTEEELARLVRGSGFLILEQSPHMFTPGRLALSQYIVGYKPLPGQSKPPSSFSDVRSPPVSALSYSERELKELAKNRACASRRGQ